MLNTKQFTSCDRNPMQHKTIIFAKPKNTSQLSVGYYLRKPKDPKCKTIRKPQLSNPYPTPGKPKAMDRMQNIRTQET